MSCRGRSKDAEIQGYFSPLIKPHLTQLRLRSGLMTLTNAGLEKRCARCKQHWPFDTEFFFANRSARDGVSDWCRACYFENRFPNGRTAAEAEKVTQ